MTICPAPYAVITSEGELTINDTPADWDALVGSEGKDHVQLGPLRKTDYAGWVNDTGLGRLPLNLVGALVLVGLRAGVVPYAGPVVITGWEFPSEGSELRPLRPDQVEAIQCIHSDARRAAGLDDGSAQDSTWVAMAQQLAVELRTMPQPTATVRRF